MSMSIIPGIESSGAALDAERMRLNIIANNIANANTTRDIDGKVYCRQQAIFESVLNEQIKAGGTPSVPSVSVHVKEVVSDPRPPKSAYMPGHPHANAQGLVELPNVNMAEEMVDMITASRAIEANVQVINTGKQMVQRALDIGRV